MENIIAHLDLDTFFVSVLRRDFPELNGKPILIGGASDRGVVAACSYETRKFGVHSAMPMKLAKKLCPEALVLKGDFESYVRASKEVTDMLEDRAPIVEKTSIDEFYLDLSGMDRFIGAVQFASELRRSVMKETRLAISMGISPAKVVSKMATEEAKPNGQLYLRTDDVQPFLNPLPVSRIPMVGEVTAQKLRNMGILTVGMLAHMPKKLLEKTFGKAGILLWERANGIDPTPVLQHWEQRSHSKETTFDKDTTDVVMIRRLLARMVEGLAYDLRKEHSSTGCVTVKIRYSNFDTHTRQLQITPTTSDQELIGHVLELFDRLYDRRLLIRLVGIRFSKLVRGLEQLGLFDASSKVVPLYHAMDRIRLKHGERMVGRAYSFDQIRS